MNFLLLEDKHTESLMDWQFLGLREFLRAILFLKIPEKEFKTRYVYTWMLKETERRVSPHIQLFNS